jgi:predicted RNA-binding protein YlxR (DUF448 family)
LNITAQKNVRTCIVTRREGQPEQMLRFVAGPGGTIVPDLKCRLPGRGCWVTAERQFVEQAARKGLFAKALKCDIAVPDTLAGDVDILLARSARGAIGLARKAGEVAFGASKVDAAVRANRALAVLHASDAACDGVRKIGQAIRASAFQGGRQIAAFTLFSNAEMDLAIGGTNVIHAALLDGHSGQAAFRRVVALVRYRGGSPARIEPDAVVAAEDTE